MLGSMVVKDTSKVIESILGENLVRIKKDTTF